MGIPRSSLLVLSMVRYMIANVLSVWVFVMVSVRVGTNRDIVQSIWKRENNIRKLLQVVQTPILKIKTAFMPSDLEKTKRDPWML